MNKILIVCLFLLSTLSIFSQPKDTKSNNGFSFITKIIPSIEVGYTIAQNTDQTFTQKKRVDRLQTGRFFIYAGANIYYPMIDAKDNMSIGIQTGLKIGFDPIDRRKYNLYFNAPVFLMGKVGVNSTRFSTLPFGIGIGAGIQVIYQDINSLGQGFNIITQQSESLNYQALAIVPSVAAEVTLGRKQILLLNKYRNMIFTIRLSGHLQEGKVYDFVTINNGTSVYKTNQTKLGHYALGLIYNF